ncbi:unnamed protein product [Polarella glacialis]|uniref:Protein disulfide-isomerase n=2 Tax=Polarella glacialis TaxID=89957 RepID=A0A813LNR3_POLGL|nr:unnamed protein product [Polarella glacialis]CAE8734415.1 unnamed protein product [Polarella glacialis]
MRGVQLLVAAASCLAFVDAADEVVVLTTATFDQHLKDKKYTLVEFYAPWCGHCKKLGPELEKAAKSLKTTGVSITKVDATVEKDLATKFEIKGYPSLVWFEDSTRHEYTGGRTAETIVDWVTSMTGPSVLETLEPSPPGSGKPRVVLQGTTLLPGFEAAASANRRKATWVFQKVASGQKVVLQHVQEDPVEFSGSADDQAAVAKFVEDNALPLFGQLDGDTFDKYLETGKGLVWTLLPMQGSSIDEIQQRNRAVMSEVATKFRGSYFVTYTDTEKFKDAVDSMLAIQNFPAVAIQKKAGDKKKYVYDGEMTAAKIISFIQDVDAGRVEPKLKSEPEPPASDDPVKVVVGSTMQSLVFTPDKDVLLEVYAPWCGHCKKLDPEYAKLAKKIRKEELHDLFTVAKIDGTANDSPVESVDWSSFPTLFFVKAGSGQATIYDGERTAKGLWKYIKKHATKADEVRQRLEKRKHRSKGDEL